MSCLPEELVTWQILPLASSKTTANKTCGGLVTTLPSEFRLITNLNKMATANRTRPTDYRHFEIIRHKYLFSQGNLNCLDFFLSFFPFFFTWSHTITSTITMPSCSGPIPSGTKVTGAFIQYQGPYFSTYSQKWNFIISIVLVWKRYTKIIGHMPWLYQ